MSLDAAGCQRLPVKLEVEQLNDQTPCEVTNVHVCLRTRKRAVTIVRTRVPVPEPVPAL